MSAAVPSLPTQRSAPSASADASTALSRRAEHRRGVRYGLSVACVVLGVYLVMHWNPGPLLYAAGGPLFIVQTVLQLVIAGLVLVVGLAVAPTSVVRAVIAVVLAAGLIGATTALFYLRLTGGLVLPMPLLGTLISPGAAALGGALLGWLIVRRRHPLTYVLVLGALLPGFVRHALLRGGADMGLIWFSDLLITLVVGVAGAWIAAGISRVLDPRTTAPQEPVRSV